MSAVRRAWWGVPAAVAVALAGCSSKPGYPENLEYPTRADRLVLRVPTAQPKGLGEPGKLDAELASLDSLGGVTADPGIVPPGVRSAIDRALAESFGSPANPHLSGADAERLALGSRLYRRHCLQCHGLTGDGRGPTGQWIYPHPRDFRRGSFKFVTTGDGGKPRKADLARTLREGLRGTGMPAFSLLPETDRELLASYVQFLSVRGQTEFTALQSVLANDEPHPEQVAAERLPVILAEWKKAEAAPTVAAPAIPDDAAKQSAEHLAAVRRGYELFTDKGRTDCATCHEDFGRTTTFRYDVWGTVVQPADLTLGGFKAGDRPDELFHRIRGGIQPVGMPAHPSLSDSQTWDLVWFVRALPYPRELPEDVRSKVYR